MLDFQNRLACTLLVLTATGSAWADRPRSSLTSSTPDASESESAPAKRSVPDLSLSPQEYVSLGMPPLSRPWSASDLAKVVKVLVTITETDPAHLPRYASKRSGKVFARLVQPEALADASNRSLSIQQRVSSSVALQKATAPMLNAYLGAFRKGAVEGADLIEVMGCMLRSTAATAPTLEEFMATLDKNDSSYAKRQDGLNQMKRGLKEVAEGALISLRERSSYTKKDLMHLMAYLDETLPTLTQYMSPDGQKATLNRLGLLIRSPAMQDFAQQLTALRAKVKSSIAGAGGR